MEQLLKYVEELNTNTPDGQIVDADTILNIWYGSRHIQYLS